MCTALGTPTLPALTPLEWKYMTLGAVSALRREGVAQPAQLRPALRGRDVREHAVVEVADESAEYIFRKIVAAYLMGYDAIVVSSKKAWPA